jgi:hypothetical protein
VTAVGACSSIVSSYSTAKPRFCSFTRAYLLNRYGDRLKVAKRLSDLTDDAFFTAVFESYNEGIIGKALVKEEIYLHAAEKDVLTMKDAGIDADETKAA